MMKKCNIFVKNGPKCTSLSEIAKKKLQIRDQREKLDI